MEGSRPPRGTGGTGRGGASESAAMLDEIRLERGYVNGGRLVPKAGQHLDRDLEDVIQGEILPRLMLLHKQAAPIRERAHAQRPAHLSLHVEEFAKFVIKHDVDAVAAYIDVLLQEGLDLKTVILHLLAPTARKLGELWDADAIDFVDVTIGTSRLQQVLHYFTFPRESGSAEPGRRVLLMPTPTDQHTFGLIMVSKFFRREGWQVWTGTPLSAEEVEAVVAEQWFALVGFSLSCERSIETLCSTIKAVRRVSKNPSVQIVVGGQIFAQNAALQPLVGADLVAADADAAVNLANQVFQNGIGLQG